MTESRESADFGFDNMKPCDMIIFDGEPNDWIDKAIMMLTGSTVTHAALYQYDNPPVLSDAGLSGLQMHEITPEAQRGVHIVRHQLYDRLNFSPVIEAANVYLSQNLSYPKANLVLLAAILVFKNNSHAGLAQVVIIDILRAACAAITDFLDKDFHDGKHPMVCSEYVFQCYVDAGKVDPELALTLHDADMEGALRAATGHSLLQLLSADRAPLDIEGSLHAKPDYHLDTALSSLLKTSRTPTSPCLDSPTPDLEEAIWQFIALYHHSKTGEVKGGAKLLTAAQQHQAEFVTPDDLLNHTVNARNLGAFKLTRIEAPYQDAAVFAK